jgi:hypothetical protein
MMRQFEVGTPCPGDADGNGAVGFADLSLLLIDWGPCPPEEWLPCRSDIDGDDEVGFSDLTLLLTAWGSCP